MNGLEQASIIMLPCIFMPFFVLWTQSNDKSYASARCCFAGIYPHGSLTKLISIQESFCTGTQSVQ